jgi:hypothetical protein
MEAAKQKNKKLRGAYLEGELVTSRAWLSLRTSATQVYCLFLTRLKKEQHGKGKQKRWITTNARELIFPYRKADEKFGISQPRFTRAIDELIENGFLDIVKAGIGVANEATVYGLSERWRKYGTRDFEKRPREKVKRGFCKTRKPPANHASVSVC